MPLRRKDRPQANRGPTGCFRSLAAPRAEWRLRRGQAGQSAVLFALAMLAMLAMASLAVDTGNLYLQRRRAQHAADVAALAGATNWQGVMPNVSLKPTEAVRDARRLAVTNGFDTDPGAGQGTHNEVTVYVPPTSEPFAGRTDHIEVEISRQVPSLFAKVLGRTEFTVTARAVARSKQISFDAATVSFDEGDQSTKFNGTADIYVQGNVYSRGGIKQQSASSTVDVSGDVFLRGTISGGGGISADEIVSGEDQVPYLLDPLWPTPTPLPTSPDVAWDNNFPPGPDGYAYIDGGKYRSIKINSGGAKTRFCTGVYYITGNQGVTINGYAESLADGATKPDGSACGGPVTFVLTSNASFDAQSTSKVYFATDDTYNNILIHTANCGNAVKLDGGNEFDFLGTIYAPCGDVQITGSSGGTVQGQIVANTVTFLGGSGPAVTYSADRVPEIPGPSLVE